MEDAGVTGLVSALAALAEAVECDCDVAAAAEVASSPGSPVPRVLFSLIPIQALFALQERMDRVLIIRLPSGRGKPAHKCSHLL